MLQSGRHPLDPVPAVTEVIPTKETSHLLNKDWCQQEGSHPAKSFTTLPQKREEGCGT